ncbi:hypothetical protein J7E91_15980 [Streptomyces sp. ISL-99]|uniref:hypothetical protein n=1 Tax=Streptomyces sp. ISL-99 TaxID=2819193 RepID=UPI001BE58872|nr:hypothetical protein [Streptomyces sp. ISL-99]MBT2526884.1 hypothetical protein [Streptomyces sp. ISL-99]
MRKMRHHASVLAALSAAALLAGTGAAQAATGVIDVHGHQGEGNITNPKDGQCYNVSDGYNGGRLLVTNKTDRKVKVFVGTDCQGTVAAVVEPGKTYRASESWGPLFYIRSVQAV